MTAPAISRPRNAGTNIGGTSHSRRLNFWIDILTASSSGGSSNSQSPIDAKGWTVIAGADTLFPTMSRQISKRLVGQRMSFVHIGLEKGR
jgi:hypothetical protein